MIYTDIYIYIYIHILYIIIYIYIWIHIYGFCVMKQQGQAINKEPEGQKCKRIWNVEPNPMNGMFAASQYERSYSHTNMQRISANNFGAVPNIYQCLIEKKSAMQQSRRMKHRTPKCIASKAVSMKERFSLETYPCKVQCYH